MSKKEINKTSPVGKAYILATLTFLVPCWIASAVLSNSAEAGMSDPTMIVVISLFAISSFSPSFGLIYLGKKKYGLLGGFGRLVVMGSIIGADAYMLSQLEGGGHAYLTFMGIALGFLWGMIDFVLIGAWAGKAKKGTV